MQTQTQEILSWFGPLDLHPVPKPPAWDFPYPWFCTLKINTLYTTWQITFAKTVQLFLHQKDNNSLHNSSSTPEDALVQHFLFEWLQINPISLVNKVSYRWTLKILHKRIRIWVKKWKWKISFWQTDFPTEFGQRNFVF